MEVTIREPENKTYKSDFYSLNPQEHEIMYREVARDLEEIGIDTGKKLTKPNGESIIIEKIDYFPQTHSMIIVAEGQDLGARTIIDLVKNGTLIIS